MRRFFLMGCAALVSMSVLAQRVEVRKSGDGKISINLASYRTGGDTASRTFLSVLKADLNILVILEIHTVMIILWLVIIAALILLEQVIFLIK